ncbi:MAG: 3-isopropylmalate dehydrogenase, partial [Deltaproteobacteria bacterium]|nr:3-isopropylmalate dehydrogenase [Deltaproteobacteria bacterium]
KDIANPIAAILSAAMMLRYTFDMVEAADLIESAVENALKKGLRTADIYASTAQTKKTGCKDMGDAIVKELK